ncbi:hypothetical protein Kpol_292p3 [Vanderwaltozyma polyspora DSM 70294]|uniref:Heterogeneous nuclear rnp K-like protein 2 n=1 Tax=Vanderwaltozyma polyspora (strain ATCC 22028 / DSM 70294 / BCRC 21397 / CBS 2163 / NBRC 10782 / NRRL Y-8283 / UCD 57-17) TaxID=436907 RepID=HEK2_VANPO|nr:uncharacterized protein Kpol_292p3 [Vanderwaltozyma polyspora DSM 70294]A7TT46.1 RecName: Full=Heterogeneous nuclear rnp K-like protein 2; AltName: Full=KH domain-containing protein 1 [Vanderwaltozyma polyspora DSM 70294]EDO14561.1 hypothetical protein Kpol_292p3 [Vanderwaltozyma polyspora DSM 70294]
MSDSDSENKQTTTTATSVTQRLLLSLKEAAKIIGTKGTKIQKVRDDNNVKIGISERKERCSDRILICTGSIEDVSNAIGDICEILLSEDVVTNDEDSNEKENDEYNSIEDEKFVYPFLNFRLAKPTLDEVNDAETLKKIINIRVLVTRAQCSAIIGTKGDRIKSLIENRGVRMIASNQTLPDSDERLLEIQGTSMAITKVLEDINAVISNEVRATREKRYVPHVRRRNQPVSTNTSSNTGSSKSFDEEFKSIVKIPEAYVGAIVGRQGNRIANLRKYSKTKIVIEKRASEVSDDAERIFEIISNDIKNVELAESMLKKNLETEIQRRKEMEETESA